MNETAETKESKSQSLSGAISNLDEVINDLRILRNQIGFNEPEKEPEAIVEQGLDNIALLMEHGGEKINNQSKEISCLTIQIRELLF